MLLAQSMHWTGTVDPVAFTIFGRDIAWYGIFITLAMLTGLIVATIRAKKIGLSFDDLVEVFICVIPLSIIGARLGYVMVRPEYFPADFGWNEFVKMIFVSFLNSNIYPLKNLLTSRVCISLETPYSKASSHFPIASHLQ